MREYQKRTPRQQAAARQSLTPSEAAPGNQALLSLLGRGDPGGPTPFTAALQARFAPSAGPRSERAQPMTLPSGLLQKAEQRYQTPLNGLKVFQDQGLADSGFGGYAQGNEIHIDHKLAPAERETVLLHEIGHVVQRGSGLAQGSGFVDSPALEQQADQGFAAPAGFSMPTAATGPVMGFSLWRKRKPAPAPDVQQAEMAQANDIFSNKLGLRKGGILNNLDVDGLNGKMMRKNAENMARLAADFSNATPVNLKKKKKGMMGTVMSTTDDGQVSVNPSYFRANKGVNPVDNHFGSYKFDIANDNYTGVHELGHVVNAKLINKLRGAGNRTKDWSQNQTASAITAQAVSNLAQRDQDFKDTVLKGMFRWSKKKRDNFDFNNQRDIDKLTKKLSGSRPSLLKKLHKAGYTSGYGKSDSAEFFAEAFADHYRHLQKQDRYQNDPQLDEESRNAKLEKLQQQYNPLSAEVVNLAKQLNANDENGKAYRDALKAKYRLT